MRKRAGTGESEHRKTFSEEIIGWAVRKQTGKCRLWEKERGDKTEKGEGGQSKIITMTMRETVAEVKAAVLSEWKNAGSVSGKVAAGVFGYEAATLCDLKIKYVKSVYSAGRQIRAEPDFCIWLFFRPLFLRETEIIYHMTDEWYPSDLSRAENRA